jgi:triosephosphate isomerase
MKFLIANWKMAPETLVGAMRLAQTTTMLAKKYKKSLSVIVCVPALYIPSIAAKARTLALGAQDVSPTSINASTGQIGAAMLKGNKVAYCIVGHSECRATGDTNEDVKMKIDRLLEKKIQPILCVGEKARDAQGWYLSTIKDQIESALAGIARPDLKRVLIAYEPVWAIGAHAEREATPDECREMIMFIRKLITDLYDAKTAKQMQIVYGGSVSEHNARAFVTDGEANGLLVGRVSLDAKRFSKLAHNLTTL